MIVKEGAVTTAAGTTARRQRKRRTQAERSAETQERVIRAATECIAELGFGNATMSRIAERAGVTWGAMQHQFGDKDAIIDAVIERALEDFARGMGDLRKAEPVLARRVRAFTERAWVSFKAPSYRVILDILMHRREKIEHIAAVMSDLWMESYGDLDLSAEQQLAAQRFSFVLLSGIATESVVMAGAEDSRLYFEVFESTLMRLLGGGKPTRGKKTRRRVK